MNSTITHAPVMNETLASQDIAIPSAILDLQTQLLAYVNVASDYFYRIPGSAIAIRYIRSSYQDDPVRSFVELLLLLFALRYLLGSRYAPGKGGRGKQVKLSEEEIDELVEDWTPEPLVAPQTEWEISENEKRPVIVGPSGPKVKLSTGRSAMNLASYNFYNLLSNPHIAESAIKTLRTYGVGPCGPPGFYGTQDVHNRVEADIAAHIGVDSCIIYAQAFSTISSVIPCFSKRGDVIVVDNAVGYAIRKGVQISRSTVRRYQHGDMEDLERVLKKVVQDGKRKPLTRRFLVAEGISEMVGDVANLPKLVELKTKYKFRLILDESHSYGVLGAHGRGLTEHQHVDPMSVDLLTGSMSGALCAAGGFCAGSDEVVDHQRITSAAYTYSAALPAMMATTASEAIRLLSTDEPVGMVAARPASPSSANQKEAPAPLSSSIGIGGPEAIRQLRDLIKTMKAQIDPKSDVLQCTSGPDCPVLICPFKEDVVKQRNLSREDQEWLLQDIVDECLSNGVLITRLKALPTMIGAGPKDETENWQPTPALKICLTTGLSKKEIEKAGATVRQAATKVIKRGNRDAKRLSDGFQS